MNWTNYILLTCELSWKASKAASCAGIGLVSLSPSAPLGPFLLPVLAAAGGRRVAGLPPAQLLPVHQETWQTCWRSNKQSYFTWKHCKCTAQPGCIQRTQQACFRSFIFNYNPTNWDVIYIYIYVYKYLDKNNYIKEKPLSWGCCSPDIAMLARKFSSSDLSLNLLFYGGLLHIETSINIHHDTAFSQWQWK